MMSKNANTRPFIVIEALDAGGSQTQTDMLAKRLKKEGYEPSQYHFPQENLATGRLIYDKFLLNKNKYPFTKREQALLYIQDFYSRADEMWRIILKGKKKQVIVSDRYCTSTMAYQTIGLTGPAYKKMMDWIEWLCWKDEPRLPKPDLVIFLDTPVSVSLKHLEGKKKDFFETRAKLTSIRSSYLRIAEKQKWIILDSMDEQGERIPKKVLHDQIWEHVQKIGI